MNTNSKGLRGLYQEKRTLSIKKRILGRKIKKRGNPNLKKILNLLKLKNLQRLPKKSPRLFSKELNKKRKRPREKENTSEETSVSKRRVRSKRGRNNNQKRMFLLPSRLQSSMMTISHL